MGGAGSAWEGEGAGITGALGVGGGAWQGAGGTGHRRGTCHHWLGGLGQVRLLPGPGDHLRGAFQLLNPELRQDGVSSAGRCLLPAGPSCRGTRVAGTPAPSASAMQGTRAAPVLCAPRPGLPERLGEHCVPGALQSRARCQPSRPRLAVAGVMQGGSHHVSAARLLSEMLAKVAEPPCPGCPRPTGPSTLRGTPRHPVEKWART